MVLRINNLNQGVYFFIEDWQEDFLKRNGLLLSNLFGEDDEKTAMRKNIFEDLSFWKKYIEGKNPKAGEEELKTLLKLTQTGASEEELAKIIDIENLLNWHIHSLIMSSTHQNNYGNNRLYFNPEKKKLQFIPWDVVEEITDFEKVINTLNPQYHLVVSLIYKDESLEDNRNQRLKEILENEVLFNELEKYYDDLWRKTKVAFYQDHNKFLTNFEVWQQVKKEKARIKKQITILKKLTTL